MKFNKLKPALSKALRDSVHSWTIWWRSKASLNRKLAKSQRSRIASYLNLSHRLTKIHFNKITRASTRLRTTDVSLRTSCLKSNDQARFRPNPPSHQRTSWLILMWAKRKSLLSTMKRGKRRNKARYLSYLSRVLEASVIPWLNRLRVCNSKKIKKRKFSLAAYPRASQSHLKFRKTPNNN